jgi:signal transduction histidine kinase
MKLTRPSLRTKLAATVLTAFVMMVLTGLVNIYVASEARDAVDTTRRTHRLVAAYGELSYQSARVEAEAWETVFSGAAGRSPAEARARARFYELLDESRAAAGAAGPRWAAANVAVRDQAPAMMAAYDQIPEFARFIDAGGFLRGKAEFQLRSDAVFEPHERFRDTLEAQVDAGSRELAVAADRASRLTRHLKVMGVASLGMGILITSFLLVLILKRLRGGLDRLESGARSFGRGDLHCRVGLGGNDELAQVGAAFDAMAQELSDKQQALEAAKVGLESAVAARTAELEAANVALAAEDDRRRRFLADVSHELRTPLTIIRGEAQVALRAAERGTLDPTPGFDRILEQTQGMGRLVDDLFLIARAEAGGLRLQREEVDVRACTLRTAADFEALAAERQAVVRAVGGAPVRAVVDPDRLRQILAALVDNALRHTSPGVTVMLDARAGDGWSEVSVSDNGPGWPPEAGDGAVELFGRFARGETRGDGSGLGLSVVRALAEAHGGSARLEVCDGGGARAVVRFPAPDAIAQDAA